MGQAGKAALSYTFCKRIKDNLAHGKARQSGYAVIADEVQFGKQVKTVSAAGDASVTFRSLLKEEIDSVRVERYDQVQFKGTRITRL